VDLRAPDPQNNAATYNSWVFASRPAADLRSWTVAVSLIHNGAVTPSIRPYAICLSDPAKVLKPAAANEVGAEREGGFNFDFFSGEAPLSWSRVRDQRRVQLQRRSARAAQHREGSERPCSPGGTFRVFMGTSRVTLPN
jgi:hypothetical protein